MTASSLGGYAKVTNLRDLSLEDHEYIPFTVGGNNLRFRGKANLSSEALSTVRDFPVPED